MTFASYILDTAPTYFSTKYVKIAARTVTSVSDNDDLTDNNIYGIYPHGDS